MCHIHNCLAYCCSYLDLDLVSYKRGSILESERSSQKVPQIKIHYNEEILFGHNQHHLDLQHDLGASASHGLARERWTADVLGHVYDSVYQVVFYTHQYPTLTSILNFLLPLLPGGGYLGQFSLGMCRWPLRTPTPL